MTESAAYSLRNYTWRQFKSNKLALIAFYFLILLVAIALLAPVLANDQPLYVKLQGHHFFPALSSAQNIEYNNSNNGEHILLQKDITNWKQIDCDYILFPLITYGPGKSDLLNADYVSPWEKQNFKNSKGQIVDMPFRFRHFLGTTQRGEDVLAGLVHGTRISLTIGILSMGLASLIGLLLGSLAGYFGNSDIKISRGEYWCTLAGLIPAYFYSFYLRSTILTDSLGESLVMFSCQFIVSCFVFILVLTAFFFTGKYLLQGFSFFKTEVGVPIDSWVSRTVEIVMSLPTLLLIITISAIAKPSIANIMLIIGCVQWTGIARFTRAEFLKIRNLEYIQAAKALGYSHARIIFFHALPNALAPAMVSIAFGIASAILIESSLSFLGVGVPADLVTWGSLINAGRQNFNAWWLIVFPGLCIFITVLIYNLIGEGLRDALDPRLQQQL